MLYLFRWNTTSVSMAYGISGGPLAIFDRDGNTVIIAPFSQFMASSVTHPDFDKSVGWGVMGGVKLVPPGYQCDTILYYAKGINKVYINVINQQCRNVFLPPPPSPCILKMKQDQTAGQLCRSTECRLSFVSKCFSEDCKLQYEYSEFIFFLNFPQRGSFWPCVFMCKFVMLEVNEFWNSLWIKTDVDKQKLKGIGGFIGELFPQIDRQRDQILHGDIQEKCLISH